MTSWISPSVISGKLPQTFSSVTNGKALLLTSGSFLFFGNSASSYLDLDFWTEHDVDPLKLFPWNILSRHHQGSHHLTAFLGSLWRGCCEELEVEYLVKVKEVYEK